MTRSEIIDMVRLRIDEVSSQGTSIVDVGVEENNPTDTMIDGVLDESAIEVLLSAPFIRLQVSDGKTISVLQESESDSTTGIITLPDDFLRLVCVQLDDWAEPLYEVHLAGDMIAHRQKNKYLRGGKSKPVVVLSKDSDGYYIRYFSSKQLVHTIKRLDYIRECKAEQMQGAQNIDAMCWIAASKVLSISSQDTPAIQLAIEQAKNLLK